MKKTLLVALAMVMSTMAFAQDGKLAVGVNVNYGFGAGPGYGLENYSAPGFGVKFQYEFVRNVRGEASFNYFLPKKYYGMKGLNFYDVNLNFHYLFNVGEKFRLYPLVGLSYETLAFTSDWKKFIETYGGDASDSKMGVNLGGGAEYMIGNHFKLNAEIKYQTNIDWPVLGIGAAYCF